jgi:hypothetical protein
MRYVTACGQHAPWLMVCEPGPLQPKLTALSRTHTHALTHAHTHTHARTRTRAYTDHVIGARGGRGARVGAGHPPVCVCKCVGSRICSCICSLLCVCWLCLAVHRLLHPFPCSSCPPPSLRVCACGCVQRYGRGSSCELMLGHVLNTQKLAPRQDERRGHADAAPNTRL